MESQSNDFSYFLTGERNLESLAEDCFSARPVDEQDDLEDNYGSDFYSSDESDQEIDSDVDLDFSECDSSERSKVQAFLTKTCGCAHGYKGSPCSSTIQVEDIVDCQNNRAELSLAELDLVILRMIHSAINCDQFSYSGRAEKTRQRTRMPFYFHSHRICPKTFLFMHRLHKNRFYSLVKNYWLNGLSLRTHGNKKRLPSSAFSAATIERVVKFIMNVAEDQALLLPGRVPGFKRIDVKLLPSSMTKSRLWKSYQGACAAVGHESVGYSKFCDLWTQLCPFIVIMRPVSDLC